MAIVASAGDTAPMTSLWHELASAQWVANTGIPLFLTIAAIVVGFWTVRRQMNHDRLLLTAQNRAQAARALGAVILEEMDKISAGWDLDTPVWKDKYFAGRDRLWSLGGADHVLGELPDWEEFSTETRTSTDVLGHVWRYAVARRRDAAKETGLDHVAMNEMVALFIAPWAIHLERVARALLRWDGIGPLPPQPRWDTKAMITGVEIPSRHRPKGFGTGENFWDFKLGEPRSMDPEWYEELDGSWRSCVDCWVEVRG